MRGAFRVRLVGSGRVIRYRVADNPARVFAITQDQGLFLVPRP